MIAIDPGVKFCGVARFNQAGELQIAEYVAVDDLADRYFFFRELDELVIEMPRIYPGSGQQKGDLNDLLNLAAVVGRCESYFRYCRRIFPNQWKGQVPKKIMNARVLSKLTPVERRRIVRVGAKDHNTIDAVGIGLWALGRLG